MKKKGALKVWHLLLLLLISFLVIGCGGEKENKVVIGADNTAEEAILSEMLKQLIEHYTDIEVELIGDLRGGETVLHPAIQSGEIDMYPEYTGTAWKFILKRTDVPEREELNAELFAHYDQEFNIKWVSLYGFNNSYGLGLYKPTADEYNIKTYSDLAKHADKLTFSAGGRFFERDDGFDGLVELYDIEFQNVVEMDHILGYDAIKSQEVDVILIFTTDGRLADTNLTVLEDDLNYFPNYLCGTVIRKETLEKFPDLEEVLMKMDNILSDSEMSELNYKVETLNEQEEKVAEEFLLKKGLISQ